MTTGVRAKGAKRIQFDIAVDGVRHRPTLARVPTEANLRRAAKQLQEIKSRIANGAFNFAEEFPEFRFLERIAGARGPRTCNNVFDEFMAHCESRMPKNDMAYATVDSYRKILCRISSDWTPLISFEWDHPISG